MVVVGVFVLGCLMGASAPARGPVYAALGDSYTSGPFLSRQMGPKGCFQSTRSYPALVAAELHVAQLDDASCAGAVIANLWKPQKAYPKPNPPQLDALGFDTSLVTVGLGANDASYVQVLTDCLSPQVAGTPCQDKWIAGGVDSLAAVLRTTRQRMITGLRRIAEKAPNAAVFVVGYPAAVPAQGSTCGPIASLPPSNVPFARDVIAELNATLAGAAASAGDYFVDEYTPSVGHDLCQPPGVRWVEPGNPTAPDPPWHPNVAGMQGMAQALVRATRQAQV